MTAEDFRKLSFEEKCFLLDCLISVLGIEGLCDALRRRFSKAELDEIIINIDEISLDDFKF
jgi:hypothetical protein